MGDYSVDIGQMSSKSRKWLKHQSEDTRAQVAAALKRIAAQPRGNRPNYQHLKAQFDCLWRYRVGPARIMYSVHDEARAISVLRVGDRKRIYD